MPSLQIKTEIQLSDLLRSVEQLSVKELDQMITQLVSLKVKRLYSQRSTIEPKLIKQINKRLSKAKQKEYEKLTQRRLDSNLTNEEQEELASLIEQVEAIEATKAQAIFTLSEIRGVTPAQLIKNLKAKTPPRA